MTQTYDYPAAKEAHTRLTAAIESFKDSVKENKGAIDDLIQDNNAPGVQATMLATQEKLDAQAKVMDAALEIADGILANNKALHLANGGSED